MQKDSETCRVFIGTEIPQVANSVRKKRAFAILPNPFRSNSMPMASADNYIQEWVLPVIDEYN